MRSSASSARWSRRSNRGNSLPSAASRSDYGDCDWTLDRGFARRWQSRSVYWQSAFKLTAQPGGTPLGQPYLVALAESVAGATAGARSVELIEQLIAIFDKSARENGIDLTNAAILAADAQTDLARRNNAPALAWHWARQSLILARVAAGGPIDDAAAKALSAGLGRCPSWRSIRAPRWRGDWPGWPGPIGRPWTASIPNCGRSSS